MSTVDGIDSRCQDNLQKIPPLRLEFNLQSKQSHRLSSPLGGRSTRAGCTGQYWVNAVVGKIMITACAHLVVSTCQDMKIPPLFYILTLSITDIILWRRILHTELANSLKCLTA
ncbi:hypothetical protein F5878DRAFT_102735 [Lentinula raphanica]|uniref:Uncharacterized protein n=1 Tax=Lentinula raphanica TaxID=153919 RepID=A0AA38UFE4_9AGAR|nr:hypothetical protein F5878DRAFT_102735 [Lentinula raphanica]